MNHQVYLRRFAGLFVLCGIVLPGAVMADSGATVPKPAPEKAANTNPLDEIVVTGTLIRGEPPVGSDLVTVSSVDIEAIGAQNTPEILATIPQLDNFGTQTVVSGGNGGGIVSPTLRGLGPVSTLSLVNGNRVVPAGIAYFDFDPTIIPPSALERVEVLPDGGSSLYGADAVGGVINYITKKRYDGFAVDARGGVGNSYHDTDFSVIGGKDWGSGSLFATYDYAWNSDILGGARNYITNNFTSHGGPNYDSLACNPGTVSANGVNYALPGLAPHTLNSCDTAKDGDFFPAQTRHSLFIGFTQRVNDWIEVETQAFYTHRISTDYVAPGGQGGTVATGPAADNINSTNPYFRPVGGAASEAVGFSLNNIYGQFGAKSTLETWGISPAVHFNLGADWKLTALANWSQNTSLNAQPGVDSAALSNALAGTTTATALNPYNPAATNPAVLAGLVNPYAGGYSDAKAKLGQLRVVADGPVFQLPGGAVRVAVGAEYNYEAKDAYDGAESLGDLSLRHAVGSRNDRAAFGEIRIPIVGPGNQLPGVKSLEFSASGRLDDYNDFGSTTNPKYGISWKPIDSLTIRGSYATSFTAPSLADVYAVDTRIIYIPVSPWLPANIASADFGRPTFAIVGGNPDLRPQTAKTYSAGFDFKPEWVPGLVINSTYWNVKFNNLITYANFFDPGTFYTTPGYSKFYILNPTAAQVQAYANEAPAVGFSTVAAVYASGAMPVVLIDGRRNNISALTTNGIDFNLAYALPTSFGSFNATMAGTYVFERMSTSVVGTPPISDLSTGTSCLNLASSAGECRFGLIAAVGASTANLTGRLTFTYRDGFSIQGYLPQTRIGSFDLFNFFSSYSLSRDGWTKNTQVTLNIDNIFDRNPPWLNAATNGSYGNGQTLGRVVRVGIHKKF